jgi:hypothetical protein
VTSSVQDEDDRFLTRREAEVIIANGAAAQQERIDSHAREHAAEKIALELALEAANRERLTHEASHDREHGAHEKIHANERAAVSTALDVVGKEREIHAHAHEREHASHIREHELDKLAVTKAEAANDIRFKSTNGYREQLDVVIRTLATKETVDGYQSHTNQRMDELRDKIVAIEKGDSKAEGRQLGQGAVVGIIVTAVFVASAVLGIVVVLANFAAQGHQ